MTTEAVAPTKRWTVAGLLELPDWEEYELIDGCLRERRHDMDATETIAWVGGPLALHVRAAKAGRILSGRQQYRVFHDGERVSKADISFFRASRAPKGNVGICELGPDFVVEVASASNGILEMWEKVGLWLAAGVELVWVVLPGPRQVVVFERGKAPRILIESDAIDGGGVLAGFTARVGDLFPPAEASPAT
jgi:Uma2 family endonuclease